MAQPIKWLADGRVLRRRSEFKAGLSNPFLNNADLVDLNDIVYQIIYNNIPNNPTGPLNVYNGVTGTITPTSYDIVLGGSLTQNTYISGVGGTHDIEFRQMDRILLSGNEVSIAGGNVVEINSSTGAIELVSPGLATASTGHVWTLIDQATGEGEWQEVTATVEVANGINLDLGVVKLGAPLIEDTTIDGDAFTYSLFLSDLNQLSLGSNELIIDVQTDMNVGASTLVVNVANGIDITSATSTNIYGDTGIQLISTAGDIVATANGVVTLTGNEVSLVSPNGINIQTPNYGTAEERTSCLTLIDIATGEVEHLPNNHRPITNLTVNTSVNSSVRTLLADAAAAGGTITVNLPQALANPGMEVKVKLISTGTLTITSTGSGATPIFTNAFAANVSTAVVGFTYVLQAWNGNWYVL